MEPKFQSSFIPRGPAATTGMAPRVKEVRGGGLYSYISLTIFVVSLILALLVFGYKLYVKGNINSMGEEIGVAQNDLIPSSAREFIRLNDRIKSTETLLKNHTIVSPLFEFLEKSTVKTVRFSELTYITNDAGVELIMTGQAQSYASVALQADIFSKSPYFKNVVFSDLRLDERGNVVFTFRSMLDNSLISYQRQVEDLEAPKLPRAEIEEKIVDTTAATSTATSTATTSPTIEN